MFGLLRPDKKQVGKRIRQIKDKLGVSLTEYGDRLGLIKPTINSYVQGYSLAPIEVVEKISKISGKSIGWIYFGEIEEYIRDYLLLKGRDNLVANFPLLPLDIKRGFLTGAFKNASWETDFGYPTEDFIDNYFGGIYYSEHREHIVSLTKEYIDQHTQLDGEQKNEAVTLISTDVYNYFYMFEITSYGDDEIKERIKNAYKRFTKNEGLCVDDYHLLGNLINILNDPNLTKEIISHLSMHLTSTPFWGTHGGHKLIEIFQSMRPALINLHGDKGTFGDPNWSEEDENNNNPDGYGLFDELR